MTAWISVSAGNGEGAQVAQEQLYPHFASAFSRLRVGRCTEQEACKSLTAAGYVIAPSALLQIEGGMLLPDDPDDVDRLLTAVKHAFGLSESDEQRLVLRLAHDLVAMKLGDEPADTLFGP